MSRDWKAGGQAHFAPKTPQNEPVPNGFLPSRLRRDVRPIYVRMGILPEMAAGIQTNSELSVPPET